MNENFTDAHTHSHTHTHRHYMTATGTQAPLSLRSIESLSRSFDKKNEKKIRNADKNGTTTGA